MLFIFFLIFSAHADWRMYYLDKRDLKNYNDI